ncbi:hypothetical protein FO440_22265 [Mucilaginibacter corticis]|uniref:Uncharacterized protein n=1 Tax=Mucilaginibacter corticis TaxID=2597670 RepID=A0A556M9M8_9SPHI|nr:hypothetical protein [Mucilaginibacter corticis]TSJ36556.1 hypothetical protein FO440_22265 [Mucilaginibacter corticis]
MKKLYIFAVGGTGSRVLKAFTMLLAAGVKPDSGEAYQIVPIIMDPHSTNLDFQRTTTLLENYMAITKAIRNGNGFFGTAISNLRGLNPKTSALPDTFTYDLKKVSGSKFKDYIGFNQMNEASQSLAQVLFSGTTVDKRNQPIDLLDIEMDIGFIGNPNIGSVVLNQFKDSAEFREFASSFTNEDRIMVISSIFGGTGAAGAPIIVKNIRNAMQADVDSAGFLRDAKIGAVTVLPYFNIAKDTKSPIQKSVFIAKTRAALSYYQSNLDGVINVMYYFADSLNGKAYKNDPGNGGQKNNAHFAELASALGIFDFLSMNDTQLKNSNGTVQRSVYKEFGVKVKADKLKFKDLEDETLSKIRKSLAQLSLFKKYLDEELSNAMEKTTWAIMTPKVEPDLLRDGFYNTHLREFLDEFAIWLDEMAENGRGFDPFNLKADVRTFITEHPAKTPWYSFKKFNYKHVNASLNAASKKRDYADNKEKLVHIFHQATQDTLQKYFKIKS